MEPSSSRTSAALCILSILLAAACGTTRGTTGEPIEDGGVDAGAGDGEATDSNAVDVTAADAIQTDAALDQTAPADSSRSDDGGADSGGFDGRMDSDAVESGKDSSAPDSAGEAGPDSGFVDAGFHDASALDAGSPEVGSPDAGSADADAEASFLDAGAVTFTNVYTTILAPNCLPCHAPGPGTGFNIGKLDMGMQASTYTNLVGLTGSGVAPNGVGPGSTGILCSSVPGLLLVEPGVATKSLLWEGVQSAVAGTMPPCGSPMPLDAGPLTQAQVDEIATWIDQGAPNN